jgi:hypothetical protein
MLGGVLETSKQQLNELLQLCLLPEGCDIHGTLADIETTQQLKQRIALFYLAEWHSGSLCCSLNCYVG